MKYNDRQRELVRDLFNQFADGDLPYVVLRDHWNLPESVAGSDLDLYIQAELFEEAIDRCEQLLEPMESMLSGVWGLVATGLRRPAQAARFVALSPREAAAYASKLVTATKFNDGRYIDRTLGEGDFVVHLVNHLAYRSTLDGSPIPVDRPVEAAMLDRRLERDGYYVPSPPDELAHLICRCVYDYEGSFPSKHVTRCEHLYDEVRSIRRLSDQFRELLSWLFYDADELVYELVVDGKYQSIRNRLTRFADY